nr:hypothetical protein [Streptomyces sp. ST1015]
MVLGVEAREPPVGRLPLVVPYDGRARLPPPPLPGGGVAPQARTYASSTGRDGSRSPDAASARVVEEYEQSAAISR